jgi:hypothetical protein
MLNARLAQCILSLVTSPERAESTVGDLIEELPTRDALKFWIAVIRTALALLWRDLSANPAQMVRLGILGLLMQYGIFFGILLTLIIVVAAVASIADGMGLIHGAPQWLPTQPDQIASSRLVKILGYLGWIGVAWVQYRVGRWLARRSPDRELAPCVAAFLVGFIVSFAIESASDNIGGFLLNFVLYLPLMIDAPLFAGAIMVRSARLRNAGR